MAKQSICHLTHQLKASGQIHDLVASAWKREPRSPGTQWIGNWACHTASLDVWVNRKITALAKHQSLVIQPRASHFIASYPIPSMYPILINFKNIPCCLSNSYSFQALWTLLESQFYTRKHLVTDFNTGFYPSLVFHCYHVYVLQGQLLVVKKALHHK